MRWKKGGTAVVYLCDMHLQMLSGFRCDGAARLIPTCQLMVTPSLGGVVRPQSDGVLQLVNLGQFGRLQEKLRKSL